MKNIAAC